MNDPVFRIELARNTVEILRVARLISPKHGVSDVVSKLDHARRPRINEERRIRQMPDYPPLGAQSSKLDGHLLKGRLVGAVIKYQQP
ncbi:MAG: hypothetical protein OXE58_08285, partial [Acidobacteria bacterium]|nr:hypothetical protein [Acidobacteriota bacterium]